MLPTLNLLLPAVPENVATARRAITGLCDHLEIAGETADDIRLAVSEACAACIEHSRNAEHDARIALDANLDGDSLLVVVRDFAGGLVRGPIKGGGRGLGMGIVKQLAERTDISSLAGGGFRVAMRFATHPGR